MILAQNRAKIMHAMLWRYFVATWRLFVKILANNTCRVKYLAISYLWILSKFGTKFLAKNGIITAQISFSSNKNKVRHGICAFWYSQRIFDYRFDRADW